MIMDDGEAVVDNHVAQRLRFVPDDIEVLIGYFDIDHPRTISTDELNAMNQSHKRIRVQVTLLPQASSGNASE